MTFSPRIIVCTPNLSNSVTNVPLVLDYDVCIASVEQKNKIRCKG